jgi:AraC-like DNA-binding protein
MTALVRSASLTQFADVAADCGLDARALVREVGLPLRCLDDADLKIPAGAVGRLLELAARRGREPAFGLRMAQSRRLSNLGPLALLVRDEPALRQVLEALVRYIHLHNEALALRIEQVGNLVSIRAELAHEGNEPPRQATELVLAVTYRVLCIFLGASWQPRLVCFVHGAPASDAMHRRVFGNAVEFGHEFNGIVCRAADLDAPNPGADPVMARYAHALLAQRLDAPTDMTGRVRQLIVLLLPRGHCRVDIVAQHVGVDRRTVARKLAAAGTSFSALVDELRRDLYERYRRDGARSIGDVAALLGFAAPSAFSRWHRREFEATARDRWRQPSRTSPD